MKIKEKYYSFCTECKAEVDLKNTEAKLPLTGELDPKTDFICPHCSTSNSNKKVFVETKQINIVKPIGVVLGVFAGLITYFVGGGPLSAIALSTTIIIVSLNLKSGRRKGMFR